MYLQKNGEEYTGPNQQLGPRPPNILPSNYPTIFSSNSLHERQEKM